MSAEYLSHDLAASGIVTTVNYLVGGITNFANLFPLLIAEKNPHIPLLDEHEWVTENLHRSTLTSLPFTEREGTNHTLDPEFPVLNPEEADLFSNRAVEDEIDSVNAAVSAVLHIRQVQRHLVSSVWYGKREPYGDVPVFIHDHLYLGSCHTSTRLMVREYGIGMILRLGMGFKDHLNPDEVNYETYPIRDSASAHIGGLMHEICDKIHAAITDKVSVLVHCYAGVSRSGTVAVAYMMKYHGMSLREAFEPNAGFARALVNFERELYGVSDPTLDPFWICESFLYFIEKLEWDARIEMMELDKSLEE